VQRIRLFTVVLAGALVLCVIGLRLGQTQSTGLRRITNTTEEAINLNPSISGDGRIVAFESTEDLAAAGGRDHFRAIRANVSADPPTFSQMGGTRAVSPAVSQDGSRIVFASRDDPLGTNPDGNSEIFLYDGSRLNQLTNTLPGSLANRTTNGNFQPSISDDGRFVAFSSNRDFGGQNVDGNLEIFVFDSLSTSFLQLTNSSGIVGFTDAKISGNGNFVAYIRDNGTTPGTSRDLIEQPRLGGSVTVLAAGVPSLALTYGRAISDDGTRVVYASQTAPNTTQVSLYDGRGAAGVRQITSLGARVTEVPLHPSISGDGSRISFATRRNVNGGNTDGSVELYLYDLPTATFSKITNAAASAATDVVSSLNDDGSVVAFNFPRVLSGAVTNSDLANDSEIYISNTQPRPSFGALTILNGASLGNEPATTKAVAPDSIASARGGLLATSTQQAQRLASRTFPTNVGGTTVTVNGRPAQIFFVSPSEVNFLVPPQTELGTADVIVTNSEGFPSRGSVTTLQSAPGVFTKSGDGTGEALALNSDTLQEAPFDPSDGKLRLTIFATGARNAAQLSVTIGGQTIVPELLLASPEMPGLDEIHLKAPASLKGAGVVNVSAQGDSRVGNPVSTRFVGGDILINEVLADPPGAAPTDSIGDANHDGVRSSSDDEFVELVNSTSRDIDISGYQLLARSSAAASDTLRHTFAAGTIVAARTAVVIFGGGAPNPSDPVFGGALILKASTGGLSLSNTGGIVTVRDGSGAVANIFEYGGATGLSGGANQSLTRSPDITGTFTGHGPATGAGGRVFSPGTRVDGTPFVNIPIARIDLTPISPIIDAGSKQQFTAKAFDTENQEVAGVIFAWQSGNPAVATIDQAGLATSSTAGTAKITASGRGIQSAPDTLTVRAVQRVLTSVEVTPNPTIIPATGAQQFTARGLDQFGNEIAGLTFTWESSATNVAMIDQNGLASGLAEGQTTIKATTQNTSGTALLKVTAPSLVVNEVLADPPAGVEGDANHDGTRDGAQDEFVELVNATDAALNISGWTLRTHSNTSTNETVRHTFAANTSVPAGNAIVLFGGGSFDPANPLFGCAQVLKTSTSGLSLTNGGLTILVRDAAGSLVTQFSYGGATGMNGGLNGGNAQSLTRSPDTTGNFVLHTTAAAAAGRKFSAGLKLDGKPFGVCPGHPVSVNISPASTSATVGQSTSFTAQAFDQFGRAMIGVLITFASDNAAVATIESTTPNPLTGVFTASAGSHNPGTAHITASANDGTTTANSIEATLTVTGPALSINDLSLNEGDSGTTTFAFTVSLSQPAPAGGVRFDIATQDGTATTGSNDYVARSLTNQSIPAGAQTYAFDVTVNGDSTVESNETFLVNIRNVSGATVAKGQGAGTIQNDDSPVLSVKDVTANEGNSGTNTFTFTVSSNMPAPAAGITFDIATANGSATSASGDYIARALTNQTIPAGQTSYSFDVTVNGDTLVEANENFFVNLSNASANASIGDAQGSGTIQNDDTPLLVISQLYGGGGNAGAILRNDFIEIYNRGTSTVDLAGWSVQYSAATGTGNWSVTPLCLIGSCLIRPGRYFLVQEDQGTGGTEDLPAPDASGTISMTTAAGKVALSSSVDALSGACPSSTNILDIMGYGGTANCFEGTGPAGAPGNTTADFRKAGGCLDTRDNANDFFVAQPNPRNSASPVGECKPEITINDVTVTENNTGTVNATFTVSLTTTSAQTITVDFATADGTARAPADYQANSGTLTFNPGALTKTITVLINGDTLDEPGETFFVNLSNAGNAAILDSQGQGTINDNDPAPTLSINDVSVPEGDSGATNATFTVLLSNASGQTVTVSYATADHTATAGSDYQSTSGSLTFSPGETSKTIAVTINGDTTFEPGETFFVNLSSPTNASISDNQGNGTITNDDPAPPLPTFAINDVSVVEGNSGSSVATFNVFLSQTSGTLVTVDYATAGGTATSGTDYHSASGTLTFAIGETSKAVSVDISGDTLVEQDETFLVNLSGATGGAIIGDNQGAATIQNDDVADLSISQVYPGGGLSAATFTNDFIEVFNRGTTTIDFSVTPYSVQFLSTTAATWAKTDLTSGTILPGRYFLVRETSGGTNGAALPTADATGTLNLTSTTAGKVALVSGTTLLTSNCPGDDGAAPFNPLNANVADFAGYGGTGATANHCYEGSGPASFTLSNNSVAVYRKAGGCTDTDQNSADFLASTPSPRNSSSPANICGGAATPNLSINDVTVTEGNSGTVTATFTVSLSAAAQGVDVSFDIATADANATTANSDYVAKSLTNQIIPAGQTTQTFTVAINGDLSVESDEHFQVNVSNVTGANVTDGQGQGTIQNDDFPTLSVNDVSAAEGDAGTKTFTFTVSLSAPAPVPVRFDIATQDNTATIAGNDYASRSATDQTIASGQQTYQFDVTVNGDVDIEPTEIFLVNVVNVTNATVIDGQGQGLIQNDDSPVLNINDVAVSEGNSGATTFTFTVTSTLPAPAGGITFDIATADNSGFAGNDYVARSLSGQTITNGNTTCTFDVTVNGDTLVEPNETFLVNVTNAINATIGDGQGQGTIQNDDVANLSISQVYGGGNNAGAAYQNDFVEIFNRGTTTVDFALTPYSVQYAGVGSNFGSNKTNLTTGSLAPGKYFLVQESGGTANGVPLPIADATGSINLGSTSGKVALVLGTTALTVSSCPGDDAVSPFNANAVNIADLIGYGNNANTSGHCYEGAAPAAAASNTTAGFRKGGGCADTNDNAADAFPATPFPRNLSSAANNCSGGAIPNLRPNLSINDVSVTEGNSGTSNATFTVSLSAPAQAADVTFDIATQDNSATTANNDYAAKSLTSQIIPAGQTTYSFTVTINGDNEVEPDETFFVNVTNVAGATITDGQGLGTIQHDDLPALSIDDVAATEGDTGTKSFTFHLSLSAAAPATVNFDIATTDSSATTADNDYVSHALINQTIAQGGTNYTFEVTVNGDQNIEANETFLVNVSNASGATVLDGQGQGTINNDDAPASSDLSISKTASSSIAAAGNNINYTITLQNLGPDVSGVATMTDTVPPNTTFQSITPPAGWTCITPAIDGTGGISCSKGTGFAVSTITFPLTVKVNAGTAVGTQISNTAQVASTTADPTSGNNSATAIVTVVAAGSADLAVSKVDTPDPVAIGNNLNYTIVLTNSGPAAAANPSFTDNLPAEVNFRSLTPPPGWSCITPAVGGSGSISCSSATSIGVNASVSFPLQVRVNPTVTDGTIIANTVSASTTTTVSISSNNSATTETTAKKPVLLISQVYGGGGNAGATYTNDFIELFNAGTTSVDFSITPYSVQYAAATAAFSTNRTDITSGVLLPGHYFLIQEASGGLTGAALPTPDISGGSINLAATAGKVALVLGTSLLSTVTCPGDNGVSPFNPNFAAIVDFLGYGSTANCYEGVGPPTVSGTNSNARSVIRTVSCTDTNVNSVDFSNPATAPTARNTATAANLCP